MEFDAESMNDDDDDNMAGHPYYCQICGEWFDDEPHTVPCTGEDCHEWCCPVCHPEDGHILLENRDKNFQ